MPAGEQLHVVSRVGTVRLNKIRREEPLCGNGENGKELAEHKDD